MDNKLDDTHPTHPHEVRRILMQRVRDHAEEVERNRLSWGHGTKGADVPPSDDEPA